MSHHYSGPDFGFPGGDARLDVTDLFAFPKPGDASKSILIMDVHPSVGSKSAGAHDRRALRARGLYEMRIDTDGDAVADIAYRVRFSASEGGGQTATLAAPRARRPPGRARAGRSSSRGRPSR